MFQKISKISRQGKNVNQRKGGGTNGESIFSGAKKIGRIVQIGTGSRSHSGQWTHPKLLGKLSSRLTRTREDLKVKGNDVWSKSGGSGARPWTLKGRGG